LWCRALPLSLLGEKLFSGIDAFALTAVPLFILTGDVLVRTGLSRKFLDVAEALTCWAKGGFGSATVLVCGMFAAISGSDAAGAAAVGRMTIDRLVESGYPRPYACALVAAGACTGILIPPSIAYIIIGLVLGIAVSTLFLAAIIPGLLILVSILVTNIVMNRLNLWEGGGIMTAAEWRANLWRTVKSGWYAFLVPGIIFYGIFSGRLTPTEAGAVAVVVTIHRLHPRHAQVLRFPGHAGQLRQGERGDPADHRLLHPAGRGAGDHRRAAGLRRCADLDDQQRIHAHR
jgi:C4-dicarboxylate transporter DctM subunit